MYPLVGINDDALTIPVDLILPPTSNADVGIVVAIPTAVWVILTLSLELKEPPTKNDK